MEMYNDLCQTCQCGGLDKCKTDFEKIQLDDITRNVVMCDSYKEKPKKHLKITYECEDRIAVVEQDVYEDALPDVKWKKVKTDFKSEFELLWKLYPRKKDKQNAYKAYERARKKGIAFQIIEHGINNYLQEIKIQNIDTPYIKHFSTWINGACWEDEPDDCSNTYPRKDKPCNNPFLDLANDEGLI